MAISAGFVGDRFYFNRLKGEAVSDIFSEYADTPVIYPLSRIDTFIEYYLGYWEFDCLLCHLFFCRRFSLMNTVNADYLDYTDYTDF